MTETSSASDIPDYPQPRTCPYHPPREYTRLHETGPLSRVRLYDGRVVWLVTGFEEARELFANAEVFSSDRRRPEYPVLAPRFAAAKKVRTFIGMDPPEHNVHRRMLISSFSVRRIAALRPTVQRLVDDLIDRMLAQGPPSDLVTSFARPVPSMVISQMLGVPYADHAFFEGQAQIAVGATVESESAAAFAELARYLDGLVRAKTAEPGDGLLDELIAAQAGGGGLDRTDLVNMALLLLVAGHETTTNAIATGVLTLLDHPDQLDALREEPALIHKTVEELLRYLSVADGAGRYAKRDVELGGQQVKAGDGLVVAISAANRDKAAFADPDAFSVRRAERHHMAFGYGVHQCIGQNLARLEMEVSLATLFRRVPGLRVVPRTADVPLKNAASVQGVVELPVTW